jgi:hypothetical protein
MLSDHERWAAEIIAFYTAPLPAAIIDSELDFFAAYYLDSARECLCPTILQRDVDSWLQHPSSKSESDVPQFFHGIWIWTC